uniref:Uncharacterized protein n=1 Tax=Theileria annulata TaxID=5874 RepID=A0A3B0N1K5_THEAN
MELEVRRTTGSSAKGIKRSIGISYILEPFLVGLSCLIGTDQFDILLLHTDVSIKFQYYILGITIILTLVGCVLINLENNFILNTFYFSYTMLLVIIHLSRVKFIYSLIFGLIFLVLGYFLLWLKTDNFVNYFILHVGVLHFLIIVLVKRHINSAFIITLHTICIGYSMTLIIIHSCSYYSKYNSGLVWFVLGLFTAWSLPQFLWSFADKHLDREVQVQSFSESLAIWRFVFCIISFLMKLTMGKARFCPDLNQPIKNFSEIQTKFTKSSEEIKKHFTEEHWKDFVSLWKNGKGILFLDKDQQNIECLGVLNHIYFYLGSFLPVVYFLFMFSSGITLKSVPLSHFVYCTYSSNQKVIFDNIKRASHLFGCCFGAAYPLSVTTKHYFYYIITLSVYLIHIILWVTLAYVGHSLSLYTLYTLASFSGFFLGYTFSYSLAAFTNSILIQTCSKEEIISFSKQESKEENKQDEKIPCCGEKFNNECYCRYGLSDTSKDRSPKPFLCSNFKNECKCLEYDQNGRCAIIICVNGASLKNSCKDPCSVNCCNKDDCKCLRVLGIYKIETVTTSTCRDCQLTVRIEGTKCDPSPECSHSGSSGTSCACTNGDGSSKCCICVKCCDKSCCKQPCGNGKCCCIKFCCCENSEKCVCTCDCKTKPNGCCNPCNNKNSSGSKCENSTLGVRLFICFKNGEHNCCLREIIPNTPDFDGDLDHDSDSNSKFCSFDIKRITLTDCCHSDMRIDLQCSLKNNYFRLNGVNYPNKNTEPNKLSLVSKTIVCCDKPPGSQCCCKFRELTKVKISNGEEIQPDCANKNSNPGSECTCEKCKSECKLSVCNSSSFVKKVDKFRVKLIVISFVIFGLEWLMVDLFAMILRYRNRPAIFNPNATYEQITKLVEKKKFNSVEQVSARLTSLMNMNKIAEGANDEKISHLKKMSEVLRKHMTEPDYLKLYSHLENVSLTFLSRSNRTEFKTLEKQLILWSHCVGLFYGYAFPLFIFIQEFFIKWEMMWNIEQENYIRVVRPRVNKMSHLSKYSLTLLDVLTTSDKTVRSIGMTRTSSWVGVMEELKWAVKLDESEKGVSDLPFATSMGEKLERFLKAWLHRQTYVGSWITKKTNVFDWAGFTSQYENIESWIGQVSPYLMLGSEYVNIPPNELNQEVKS